MGKKIPVHYIGVFTNAYIFLLIFTPPNVIAQESPWIIFSWLVFSTCLFDVTESIWAVNYLSLFPDKFRDRSERRTMAMFKVYLGFIGSVLAFILPPFIIVYGDLRSYAFMGWICVMVSFVCGIFMIPGVRDDKETVENYLMHYKEVERDSFFKTLKQMFSQKNFVAFLCIYTLY